jgi:phosphoribosylamine---glycine ligase
MISPCSRLISDGLLLSCRISHSNHSSSGLHLMKILVLGSGGREHALVWKLSQSKRVEKIFCIPGSDAIAGEARTVCLAIESGNDFAPLLHWAGEENIDLVVIGPETPLAAGVVDANDIKIVGPCQSAARLESSKVFAKNFMSKYAIPTAEYFVSSRADETMNLVKRCSYGYPLVLKADGLAAGKGVVLAKDYREAEETIRQFMVERTFGEAGARIVVEECLKGRECSFMVFADGEHYLPMVPSQDHKRVFDNDQGPNTGGMGAFSDDSILSPPLRQTILHTIVEPTLRGMKVEGTPYRGILYFGLMLTDMGPKVLEFNCRFGDPETQPVLMRMQSDLVDVFEGIVTGRLHEVSLDWLPDPTVCVVLASGGYPGHSEKGKLISGLDQAEAMEDVKVFHAGSRAATVVLGEKATKGFQTAGGRVLGVTAKGNDLRSAAARAYQACSMIQFEGMHYRRDIAVKFLG